MHPFCEEKAFRFKCQSCCETRADRCAGETGKEEVVEGSGADRRPSALPQAFESHQPCLGSDPRQSGAIATPWQRIFREFRPHRLNDEIHESPRRVEVKLAIRIAADLRLHALLSRPVCELFQIGFRRLA